MHRNTYLLVIFLAVFAALVVGVNLGKRLATPAPTPAPTPAESPSPSPISVSDIYTNKTCGFSFIYPSTLTLSEESTGSALLVHSTNKDESIVVACQPEIPRPPLTPDKIETVLISSISANLYHDASAKDGTQIDELIFRNPKTNMDIFIAGFGETFNSVIATVKLLP